MSSLRHRREQEHLKMGLWERSASQRGSLRMTENVKTRLSAILIVRKRQPITRKEQPVPHEEGMRMTHWVGPELRWLLLSLT